MTDLVTMIHEWWGRPFDLAEVFALWWTLSLALAGLAEMILTAIRRRLKGA